MDRSCRDRRERVPGYRRLRPLAEDHKGSSRNLQARVIGLRMCDVFLAPCVALGSFLAADLGTVDGAGFGLPVALHGLFSLTESSVSRIVLNAKHSFETCLTRKC